MTEQSVLPARPNGNGVAANHHHSAVSTPTKRTPPRPSSPRSAAVGNSTPPRQRGARKPNAVAIQNNSFLQLLGAAESSLPYVDDRTQPDLCLRPSPLGQRTRLRTPWPRRRPPPSWRQDSRRPAPCPRLRLLPRLRPILPYVASAVWCRRLTYMQAKRARPNTPRATPSSTQKKTAQAKAARAPDASKTSRDGDEEESGSGGEGEGDDGEGGPARGSRFDCSLSKLTKKFQDLVRSCNGTMDLNVAADTLGVRPWLDVCNS